MSALIDAATEGNLAKVEELLKGQTPVDSIDESGYTGLHCAAEEGHVDVAKALIKAGANVNQVTFHTEFTALHFAVSKGHYTVATFLIESGADLDLCTQSGCYGSPLHYAIAKEATDMVKSLIKKGADVDLVSGQGYSPLLLATSLDQSEVAQLLLITGADVNQADWDEKTPLHLAAGSGFGKIVKILVDSRADLGLKDGEGQTAEAVADKVKEVEIAAYLKACVAGAHPPNAPKGKKQEVRVFRVIEPVEGCGEGCAMPE